jgi:hypothetical protein
MSATAGEKGGLYAPISFHLFSRLLREANSELIYRDPGRWFVRKIGLSEELYGSGWTDPTEAALFCLAFVDPLCDTDPDPGYRSDIH